MCASASSITTRIKTLACRRRRKQIRGVRVHLPLQQGLRRICVYVVELTR